MGFDLYRNRTAGSGGSSPFTVQSTPDILLGLLLVVGVLSVLFPSLGKNLEIPAYIVTIFAALSLFLRARSRHSDSDSDPDMRERIRASMKETP